VWIGFKTCVTSHHIINIVIVAQLAFLFIQRGEDAPGHCLFCRSLCSQRGFSFDSWFSSGGRGIHLLEKLGRWSKRSWNCEERVQNLNGGIFNSLVSVQSFTWSVEKANSTDTLIRVNEWCQSFPGSTGSFVWVEQINLETVYNFILEVKIWSFLF